MLPVESLVHQLDGLGFVHHLRQPFGWESGGGCGDQVQVVDRIVRSFLRVSEEDSII